MPTIDGLISGLDTSGLIQELLRFQRRPIEQIAGRIKAQTDRRTALLGITAKLLGLQSKANLLTQAASFLRPTVASSSEDVLEARGGEDLPAGSYTFKVKQLAEGTQVLSRGFVTADTAVGAGTLTIDAAGASLARITDLDVLNGGQGVARGSIRITNRAGSSVVVDISSSLTLEQAVSAINSASGLNVTASIQGAGAANPGAGLLLTDSSGGAGTLQVQEVGGGSTAADLGILGSGSGNTLTGAALVRLGSSLPLSVLNDGLGVRVQSGADLSVTQRDGTAFTVDLSGAATVGDVVTAINNAAGNTSVTVTASGRKLVATDGSTGASTFAIANVGTGRASTDFGLTAAASGGTITGVEILADADSVLLRSLHGGSGIASGSIQITNRAGSAATVNLSGAETLRQAIESINSSGIAVTATLNASGDGLLLTDRSSGTGLFKVEEVSGGTTASSLGILNAAGSLADQIAGTDLEMKYIGENTRLAGLNGGRGVSGGRIRITDASGRAFDVDLSQEDTIGEVLNDINGAAAVAGSDLTAAVNSKGTGIVLTASAGTGTVSVAEANGGGTARDLNILGSAPAGTPRILDGSFQRSITISSTDTITSLADRINDLDIGVRASILNDGSAISPYRLQITSGESGVAGRIVVGSAGGTNLAFSTIAQGRDAVLFYGGDGARPVVVRSSGNEFADIVKGLTVTARSISASPVVVTAIRDLGKVEEAVSGLVETYNGVIDDIRALTRFDAATGERGPLLGESSLRTVERQLSDAILKPILGLASGKNLAAKVGLRVLSNGKLSFDPSQFGGFAAGDPEGVRQIFNRSRPIEETTRLADFENGDGISATAGGAEFRIHTRSGATLDVDLSGDVTVRDLLASINQAAGNAGKVTASIAAGGRALLLTDTTSGSTAFRTESLNGSSSLKQIGLDQAVETTGGDRITGTEIDLTDDPGVSRRLYDALASLLDTSGGLLQKRSDFYQSTIDELNKRATIRREQMSLREVSLRRQFAQLEVLLGRNQNVQQRLSSALGGLSGVQ